MAISKFSRSGLVSLLPLLLASGVYGQIIYGLPASGNTGLVYTHWKLERDTAEATEISQFWVPVSGFLPLRDNMEARFYFAGAANNLQIASDETDITGLSDARIQISRSLADDRFLLSLGVSLPTGKRKLDQSEERPIIEILAQSFLDFPIRRYGEGFGFNVLVGGAQKLGEISVSGGVLYEQIGSYRPYDGFGKYDPGDIISVNAGADIQQDYVTWSGNAVFTTYLPDKMEGNKVFRQSEQLDLRLSGQFDNRLYQLVGQLRYVLRGRNSRYNTSTEQVRERLKLYGSEFQLSAGFTYHFPGKWYAGSLASLRLIGANEEDFGSSNTLMVGGTVGRKLGEYSGLELGVKYLSGEADGGNISLSGLQVTSALVASF